MKTDLPTSVDPRTRKLWKWLGIIFLLSFGVLGFLGYEIYLKAPPIPQAVVSVDGRGAVPAREVQHGQQAWLSAGGQQLGTVWGHGSYVAPDWSADWLHREATALQQVLAGQRHGRSYEDLAVDQRGAVDVLVKQEMRTNRYDATLGTITVSRERAEAILATARHYDDLFGHDASLAQLRDDYAMGENALPHAPTARPWPPSSSGAPGPQPPTGRARRGCPTPATGRMSRWWATRFPRRRPIWSIVSVVLLLAGIAAMLWYHGAHKDEPAPQPPKADPLFGASATPSMKATRKYFFAVIGLILLQIGMGIVTAHYAVEGQAFFGIPLAAVLPYVVSRTGHTQVGIFWIATAWLATGLYIAPLLSGRNRGSRSWGSTCCSGH